MAQNYKQDGETLTILESALVHPSHTDGLVNSGDPVNSGILVGVAQNDAAASTDYIAVATGGVFNLAVVGANSGGSTAVSYGDRLYIETGVINKNTSKTPFGIALGAVESAATTTIPVKVCGAGN